MTYTIGDEVIANGLQPIMTITEITGKKAICEWMVDDIKQVKKYFLTELKMASELENIKEKQRAMKKIRAKIARKKRLPK